MSRMPQADLKHALWKLKKKSLAKQLRSAEIFPSRGMNATRRRPLPSTAGDVVFAMKKER
jgi:hypothetical protein